MSKFKLKSGNWILADSDEVVIVCSNWLLGTCCCRFSVTFRSEPAFLECFCNKFHAKNDAKIIFGACFPCQRCESQCDLVFSYRNCKNHHRICCFAIFLLLLLLVMASSINLMYICFLKMSFQKNCCQFYKRQILTFYSSKLMSSFHDSFENKCVFFFLTAN